MGECGAIVMDELDYFLWEQAGAVATITFNRPAKRNGLDLKVMLEFEKLIHRARDTPEVKVVIATGVGTAFCAGADFTLVRDAKSDDDRRRVQNEMGQIPRIIGRVFDTMLHIDVISIAAVNGYAVGGGWSIALGFDHVVAVEEAQFWLPEVEIGQAFRGLANVGLTQRLGPVLAKEALILGRRFSAQELRDVRVVNQICTPDDLMQEANRVAQAYLALPWRAVINTRREINATIFGPQYY
jgi:enoyl-CoA hydratase/carnithine racemase